MIRRIPFALYDRSQLFTLIQDGEYAKVSPREFEKVAATCFAIDTDSQLRSCKVFAPSLSEPLIVIEGAPVRLEKPLEDWSVSWHDLHTGDLTLCTGTTCADFDSLPRHIAPTTWVQAAFNSISPVQDSGGFLRLPRVGASFELEFMPVYTDANFRGFQGSRTLQNYPIATALYSTGTESVISPTTANESIAFSGDMWDEGEDSNVLYIITARTRRMQEETP